jgi:hypothetical protein
MNECWPKRRTKEQLIADLAGIMMFVMFGTLALALAVISAVMWLTFLPVRAARKIWRPLNSPPPGRGADGMGNR